ncbi:hypothetical protein CASFOL_005037 [Castilleja foliolosa]|uniref:Transposase MuDR plant domain-containing protein n=1 Tax=Castilleja foliolosa TaxID=1961234 RepID=A0ABD3E6C9_9LAMI
MAEKNWTVKLHHGGQFVDKPRKSYVGGKIAVFDGMVEDKMSLPELWDMGKELSYPAPRSYKYYYKIPKLNLAKGLVLLEKDNDVLKMLECHLDTSVINAYMVAPPVEENNPDVAAEVDGQPNLDDVGNDEEELEAETDEEQNDEGEDGPVNNITFGDEEEDQRLDSDIDDDVYKLVDVYEQRAEYDNEEVPVVVSEDESDNDAREYDSDELRSIDGSGDESKYFLYREPTKPQEKPILKIGMKFVDAKQFRKALRSHAVLSGYDIHFQKNEGSRVTCVCKESQDQSKLEGEVGCKWRIHASWNNQESAFIIKTYHPNHSCSKVFENTQATSAILSDMYIENFQLFIKIHVVSVFVLQLESSQRTSYNFSQSAPAPPNSQD